METHQPIVTGVSVTAFAIATIFVSFYMSSCIFVVKSVKLADYLMLSAWFIDVAFATSFFYAIAQGFGLHDLDIEPGNRVDVNKSIYSFLVLYDLTSMAAKSSILIFYLELTNRRKVFYWANQLFLFVVVAAGVGLSIHQIFSCHPVTAVYHLDIQSGKTCTNIFITSLASSPFNISTDIAILCIPIPLLTRIRLPFRQRLILVLTFGAGISVIGVDVVRIAFLQSTAKSRLQELHSFKIESVDNNDYTWYSAYSLMWSVVEVNMTIACACVPSIKPLASRMGLIGRTKKERSSGFGGSDEKPSLQKGDRNEGTGSSSGSEITDEMMKILTGGSGSRPSPLKEVNKYPADIEAEYPRDIKLLNYLNLRPRRMVRLNSKESIPANVLVIILFFLWGFAYGFLNVLNENVALSLYGPWRTRALSGAYFLGYLLVPSTAGRYILRRFGFTAGFTSGLYVFAFGTLLIWPASALLSFSVTMVANAVIGSGLGIIETTANLFNAMCGPMEYAEARLCASQGFQGIGALFSRLLGGYVVVAQVNKPQDIVNLQWAYLAICFYDVFVAVAFYYLPVPEAPDDDMRQLGERRSEENNAPVLGMPVFLVTLTLGVWSQFFYIGAQETFVAGFHDFRLAVLPTSKLSDLELDNVGTALFAVARFAAAIVQWKGFKARYLLLISFLSSVIVFAVCMNTAGTTSMVFAMLGWVTFAPIFPIVFAISLRGTGVYAKTAASFLATAVGSGTFSALIIYAVTLSIGNPAANVVTVAFASAGAIFPLYLNLVPAARRQADPIKDEYVH